jgi:glycosyltransferase involved in cell wall biosynthesis
MVGDEPDRVMLENCAWNLGIEDKAVFTGFQSNSVDYLDTMDIFMLSSHTEGPFMTLLKAMSLGKACIVTQVGGNPELVQGEINGLLVPASDPMAMSAAMVRLADDRAFGKQLGEHSNTIFHCKFSAIKISGRYACFYPHVTSF